MATNKQDVEKSELRKVIEKLRDENKEYETRVTALRRVKQTAQDVKEENYLDAEILSIEERIFLKDMHSFSCAEKEKKSLN